MTRRLAAVALVGVFCSSVSVFAQTARTGFGRTNSLGAPTAMSARHTRNAAIALLRRPVESVDWVDTPMELVIDWLKGEGKGRVNVIPRWNALNVESIDRDTLVTLQLNNTTVSEVLNELLDQLSPDGELRFHAQGNTLRISTKADFDRKMYQRIYNVTDILFRVPNFGREAPNVDLQNTTSGGQGGSAGGQSVFQGGSGGGGNEDSGEQAEQDLLEQLEDLRAIIEETIEPESWDTATGAVAGQGRIRIFRNSLIVTNTIEVHEAIAGRFAFE